MNRCLICRTQNLEEVLDLGRQPIANRFLQTVDAQEAVFPMVIGQCQACGMVQSLKPVPVSEVVPRVDWISYNEPEGHLDAFVEKLCHLPGITRESVICGVTFKDDTTLARFNKKGFARTWRMSPRDDLDILDSRCGAEMIQDRLTCGVTEEIVQKHGAADLVIVRHVFEHAYDPYSFMQAIKKLIHPNGYIVLEVPDCSRAFDRRDYTTLWEEHILYFTPVTFKDCFARMGFSLCQYQRYPYLFEDSLIAVVQPLQRTSGREISMDLPGKELKRIKNFAGNLPGLAERLRMFLKEYRRDHGKIALFGAGHLACTFVNILGLKEDIAFFVDDNPNKKGLFMPGSRLPIYGSHALLEEHIKLCLLSLNPLSEEKVIANNKNFTDQGGTFKSIFPASQHVLELLAVDDEEHEHAHQNS